MILIHKKGPRDNTNNYQGVVLLTMCSRILARVIASRLRSWTEKLHQVGKNQNGFRPGRSTANATQVFVRIQEDMEDLRKRRRLEGQKEESEDPEARLLDLRKAYSRVNKPALWGILRRYGLRGDFMDTIIDIHETTEYWVSGRKGDSDPWILERGLREGGLSHIPSTVQHLPPSCHENRGGCRGVSYQARREKPSTVKLRMCTGASIFLLKTLR